MDDGVWGNASVNNDNRFAGDFSTNPVQPWWQAAVSQHRPDVLCGMSSSRPGDPGAVLSPSLPTPMPVVSRQSRLICEG